MQGNLGRMEYGGRISQYFKKILFAVGKIKIRRK
jgi:hypothetical protein